MAAVVPRWMWQNFIQLGNTLIFSSSEEVNFPNLWLRDSLRSKRWRSKTGWTILAAYNDVFDFQEAAVVRQAVLTAGTYETGALIAAELQLQMNTVGSNTYLVTYSAVTNKFTITRTAGGGDIDGVVINFFNDIENSNPMEFGVALTELATETRSIDSGIENGNKIEYTVYILDGSGNKQFCTETNTFNF